MKKIKKLICFSLFTLILAGCSQNENEIVASVDGETIDFKAFYEYMQSKPSVKVIVGNQTTSLPVAETLAFQALEDLVNQKLLMHLAADLGLIPTKEEVEKEIEFKRSLNPNFIDRLTDRGFNISQIRKNLKMELAQEKVLTKGIQVTMEEVDNYIKRNPKQFITPAIADLYWIYVKSERAKKRVDQELISGQSFRAVATRYSEYPNAERLKGRFPQRVIGSMPPKIQNIAKKHKIGQKTEWIPIQNGYAKFFIEQKTEEKPIKMDEKRKVALKRRLALQRGRLANDLSDTLLKKFKESNISVDYQPLKKPWGKLKQKIKDMDRLEIKSKELQSAGAQLNAQPLDKNKS